MTHHEQPTQETLPMDSPEHAPSHLILATPGEGSHGLHPALRLANTEDATPAECWLCLGHPVEQVQAAATLAADHGLELGAPTLDNLDGFYGWQPNPGMTFGELVTIAEGIAQHGAPYAAWLSTCPDPNLLDGFTEYYTGTYPDAAAWAEDLLGDAISGHLDAVIPPSWRDYVTVDYDALALELIERGVGQLIRDPDTDELHGFLYTDDPTRMLSTDRRPA